MRRTAIAVVAVFLAVGASAYAQPSDRGYVQGIGGLTFGTEPSQIFGGGLGVSIGRHLLLTFDGGRMNDVLPTSVRRELDAQLAQLGRDFGVTVSADMKAPATYWMAGLRVRAAPRGRLAPFATVTAGTARISPSFSVVVEGLQVTPTDEELEEAGLTSANEPLLGVGGGVEIAVARRLGIEIGYQYNRIFTDDPAVNLHRAYTGVNFRF